MDLRLFLGQLERLQESKRVEGADWNLEIGTLTELTNERGGTALLFDHIKDYPPGYRIVTNVLSTPRRLAIAFGFPENMRNLELVRRLIDKFKSLKPVPPVYVIC